MTQFLLSDQNQSTVILLTHAPTHQKTSQAYHFVQNFYAAKSVKNLDAKINIFLYSDAVVLANRLIWLPEDMDNMAKNWQRLALQLQLPIQVCVSAALARGVTDKENASRHGLSGDNLAEGFELVGLGELAMHLHQTKHVYQF